MKMKKKRKRRTVSIRLEESTIKDLDDLSLKLAWFRPTRSHAIRFLIHKGFQSIGNWRRGNIRP